MLSLCGKAAGLIWWELHYCRNGKDFCHHRKETLNSIWILPDDLACHLGVNNALKSGSGSCSIDILRFADCNHQNSDVRVLCNLPQFQSQCCYLVCVRVNSFFWLPQPCVQANLLCPGKCSRDRIICGCRDSWKGNQQMVKCKYKLFILTY